MMTDVIHMQDKKTIRLLFNVSVSPLRVHNFPNFAQFLFWIGITKGAGDHGVESLFAAVACKILIKKMELFCV